MNYIKDIADNLILYIEKNNFKGYYPYDINNSAFKFQKWGHLCSYYLSQVHKRNPVNIRPLLGIKKGYIPKGMGLMLHAFSILYKKYGEGKYIDHANFCFKWLLNNHMLYILIFR